MTSALARQTAIVLINVGWDGACIAAVFRAFHANQGLKVAQSPHSPYLYSVVHSSGYTFPQSEAELLDRAIAYCDLCVERIPETTKANVIFNQLSFEAKERIKQSVQGIIKTLDLVFPEFDED